MASASPISADRWRQIEDIFSAASQLEEHERAVFLQEACGSDMELRNEVDSLLASSSAVEAEAHDPFLGSALHDLAEAYLETRQSAIAEGVRLDHYRVIRLLEIGGMGEVYLAEDIRLNRRVCLKMLPLRLTRDGNALERFESEARIVSALNQANLLTVFEFCHVQGRHFLVTEFIEGETLRQKLKGGPLKQAVALDIAIQTATGLAAAHASGVIHRDIKPENIMVRRDGCVKLLDFGIAKLAEAPAAGETTAGGVLGTPRYMSPEQTRGSKLDQRTDIFSLGAVIYEMLTGQLPFSGNPRKDVVLDILRGGAPVFPQGPDKVSPKLQQIVGNALTRERDERYQTTQALLSDLQQFRRDTELNPERRMRRAIAWVLAILLAACICLAFLLFVQHRNPAQSPRPPRSLAVLPFRNLKPDNDTDFLGFSLADEVIARLGYVKALTVRPSTAIVRFRNVTTDLRKTAEELNADLLLTGTYLKDGDNLRITARLIGFNPEAVLWQDTMDVKYGRLLTVQDRVAGTVIRGLAVHLQPDEQKHLVMDRPVNSLAYEYYLRGVDLYSTANFQGAADMLEKSVAIDGNYAPTWAYLGRAYTTNASLHFGGRQDYRRAEAAYEKAIALDPVFPEPRVYMANLFTDTGRVESAVPLLRVALRNSPNNAEAHWELGYAYRYGGMLKESVAECELARRLDPEVKINSSAFNTYLYLLEYDKFMDSLPNNDTPLLVFYHGLAGYYKHDYTAAIADFDRAFELAPDLLPAQVGKALSEGLDHRQAQGLARLHQTEALMNARGVRDPEAMYKVSQAYALFGERNSALRMLQQTVSGGFFCYSYIAQDPLLETLHGTPEFSHLLDRVRQRADQFAQRFSVEEKRSGR